MKLSYIFAFPHEQARVLLFLCVAMLVCFFIMVLYFVFTILDCPYPIGNCCVTSPYPPGMDNLHLLWLTRFPNTSQTGLISQSCLQTSGPLARSPLWEYLVIAVAWLRQFCNLDGFQQDILYYSKHSWHLSGGFVVKSECVSSLECPFISFLSSFNAKDRLGLCCCFMQVIQRLNGITKSWGGAGKSRLFISHFLSGLYCKRWKHDSAKHLLRLSFPWVQTETKELT